MKVARPDWHGTLVRIIAGLLLLDVAVLSVMSAASFLMNSGRFFLSELFIVLLLIGVYLVPALIAAGLIRRGCAPWMMGAAIVLALTAMGVSVLNEVEDRVTWSVVRLRAAIGMTATTLCIFLLLCGGLRLYDSNARLVRWARRITLATAAITSALVLLMTWFFEMIVSGRLSPYAQYTGAAVVAGMVLVVIGALAVRALYRRERQRHGRVDASLPRRVMLIMNCPHCGEALAAPAGDYRCPACRFAMEIIIEEPRCACGYLIYEHTSAQCPECGREIPEADRGREEINE